MAREMTDEELRNNTHRDDAMNLRCNDCEHLARECICEHNAST